LNDAFVGMVDADQIVETPDGFKDEDDMASNSATAFCSQQSIKAYVDAQSGGGSASFQNRWTANGWFRVDTDVDGAFISDTDFDITGVWIWRGTAGSSSSTIVDINKNGTTMYTTQGNRPTIAFDDGDNKVDCTLPDVTSISAGDVITIDIDQVEAGNPKDLIIMIEGS